jgi:putative membrane protein
MTITDSPPASTFDPTSITRPDPALMTYYFMVAALTVMGFPFVIWPLYFKYRTLQYRFDDKGISMSWGLLFRKEIYLTYRRIQDIHVTRNLFQRWLGLAAVSIQTASGSSGAEMAIEGVLQPELLRDFLYTQMRGVREDSALQPAPPPAGAESRPDEGLQLLREIRDELRRLRTATGRGPSS